MIKKSLLTLMLLAVTSAANAAVITNVDCLSANGTSDISLSVKDAKKMDYGRLYDSIRGQGEELKKGFTKEYSDTRFVFSGRAGAKVISLEMDLHSTDVNNGLLTVAGKSQKVQCYISDLTVED